ncbi:MAG: AAA family ATPase [Deltaproteobacteria bacterium]|nr:AAA family ATPase [Deltaproteobacteria bacterium]
MYNSYFGFKENPFSLTPDPHYLYLSRHHKEAFDNLVYGINERKGFIVITGGIGTGKTTLCRALLGTLEPSTKAALVFNAYISDMELLRTINQEFGIEEGEPGQSKKENIDNLNQFILETFSKGGEDALPDRSKKDHIDNLNQFLLETFSKGGNAVLLIDEAQNLSHTVLEEIRMLSNLETEKEKLVQIVLVGQLELRELLASPALKQLDERIMVRYDLKPLDKQDVQGYIEHRLVVAGGKGNLRFTKGAMGAIYAYSKGNPRRINGLCDRALLIAYSKDEFTVSKKTIQKAIEDIGGDVTLVNGPKRAWAPKFTPVSALLLLIVILVAGFGGWSLRKDIPALTSGERVVTRGQALPVEDEEVGTVKSAPSIAEQEVLAAKTEEVVSMLIEPSMAEQEVLAAKTEKVASIPMAPEIEASMEPEIRASREPEIKASSLFLSEHAGLAGLFRLFDAKERQNSHPTKDVHWGLYSFNMEPEHYILFKRPFWMRTAPPAHNQDSNVVPSPRYLLISEVTPEGAVAIDADGKEQSITRDFIMTHWDNEVCWIYPYEDHGERIVKGMRGPDVVKLQYALNEVGYSVQPTGLYDGPTFDEVVNFQNDFRLKADGIVGTRTKGLLYQMTDELY